MMKWYWLLVLVLVIPLVRGVQCEDVMSPPANCTLVTPVISCGTYNYSVLNESGSVVDVGSLGVWGEGTFYLNFSQGMGRFVVVLCDGGSRELVVRGDDDMIIAAIILLPLLFGFLVMWGVSGLDGERHSVLKIFLSLLSFVMFFVSFHMGLVAVVKYFDFPELQLVIGQVTYWSYWLFAVIIIYWLIYGFVVATRVAAQKRRERLEY